MPKIALRYFYLGQCVHICDLTSNMSVYLSTPAVSGAPDVRSVVDRIMKETNGLQVGSPFNICTACLNVVH
jgi:hypothetical protein